MVLRRRPFRPTSQTETRQGSATETQCFGYITLDRLVQAWTATDACQTDPASNNGATVGSGISGGAYWTSWDLDPLGQRKTQTDHNLTGPGDTVTTYTYDGNGAGQPHTLTKASTTGPSGTATSTYSYNATGDATQRSAGQGQQSLTWDDAGNLTAVTGRTNGDSNYIYDADGNLLLQKDPGTTTLYLPGEQLALDTGTGQITGTRFYALPGGGEAVRTGTGSAYTFETGDQHNTATLTIDNTFTTPPGGSKTPYGAPRGTPPSSWPDNHGFLNKPEDTSTGLTDVGARWYDPNTGTFASLDPLFEATDTQQQGGYNYGASNPITNSDPTGEMIPCDGGCPNREKDKTPAPSCTVGQCKGVPGYVGDPREHGTGRTRTFTGNLPHVTGDQRVAAAIAQDQAEARHLAMLEKIEQSKARNSFWHRVVHFAVAAAPIVSAVALATSLIPGVDALTGAAALLVGAIAVLGVAADGTIAVSSGYSAIKDLSSRNYGKAARDSASGVLSGVGVGAFVRVAKAARGVRSAQKMFNVHKSALMYATKGGARITGNLNRVMENISGMTAARYARASAESDATLWSGISAGLGTVNDGLYNLWSR